MSVQSSNHAIVVEVFQSGPKWQIDQHCHPEPSSDSGTKNKPVKKHLTVSCVDNPDLQDHCSCCFVVQITFLVALSNKIYIFTSIVLGWWQKFHRHTCVCQKNNTFHWVWRWHNFTSSINYFLPGLGFQHSVMGVEVLTDHEEDHGHCDDPQHGHVIPWQQRGTGQDGWRVDARQATVHEWYS